MVFLRRAYLFVSALFPTDPGLTAALAGASFLTPRFTTISNNAVTTTTEAFSLGYEGGGRDEETQELVSAYLSDLNTLSVYPVPTLTQLLGVFGVGSAALAVGTQTEGQTGGSGSIITPDLHAVLLPLPLKFVDICRYALHARCVECDTVPQHLGLCMVCGRTLCLSDSCCQYNGIVHRQHIWQDHLISEEWMHAHVCSGLIFPVESGALSAITFSKHLIKPLHMFDIYLNQGKVGRLYLSLGRYAQIIQHLCEHQYNKYFSKL